MERCQESIPAGAGGPASGRRNNASRSLRLWGVVFLVVPAVLVLGRAGFAEVLDRVVATVDGTVITQSELQEAVEAFQRQAGEAGRSAENPWDRKALERRILEDLVDRKLMDQYASKQGITATDEEMEQAVKDVLARANMTREEFLKALQKEGVSYEEYRNQIRDQIIKAKMIHREVRAQIVIKDEEIESYYYEHPDEFRTEEGYMIRHVFLALPQNPRPEVVEAVLKEARRIREEILGGLPFEEAAAKYSQDPSAARGGWLGFFRKGALSEELDSAIGALEEGQVSEPILTQAGVHIVRLEERTTGGVRSLERVRETIREKLFEEAAERQFEKWRKDLRKNAYVEIFL
jgi:peptidyl-prolyl cis-trans isomerase SurA